MNYHIGDVQVLVLRVGGSGDVRELEKFFDSRKYGRNQLSRMVSRRLDDIIVLEEFMWYQLTIVFFEASENSSYGVVDGVRCEIADICEICLLGCAEDLLHENLLDSLHLAKETHFIGVCNSSV